MNYIYLQKCKNISSFINCLFSTEYLIEVIKHIFSFNCLCVSVLLIKLSGYL